MCKSITFVLIVLMASIANAQEIHFVGPLADHWGLGTTFGYTSTLEGDITLIYGMGTGGAGDPLTATDRVAVYVTVNGIDVPNPEDLHIDVYYSNSQLYPCEDAFPTDLYPAGSYTEDGHTIFYWEWQTILPKLGATQSLEAMDYEIYFSHGGSSIWQSFFVNARSFDMTGDKQVNLADTSLFSQYWSSNNWTADYNYDTVVNLTDISLYSQNFGTSCQ